LSLTAAATSVGTVALMAVAALPVLGQLPVGHRVVLSEVAVGRANGPYYVTLDSGAVYRVEIETPDEEGTLAQLLDSVGTITVSVAPRQRFAQPGFVRATTNGDGAWPHYTSLLFFAHVSGDYRVDASAPVGVVYTVRVLKQADDSLEWSCVKERDRGGTGPSCRDLHAARPVVRYLGVPRAVWSMLLPVAAFLFIRR